MKIRGESFSFENHSKQIKFLTYGKISNNRVEPYNK